METEEFVKLLDECKAAPINYMDDDRMLYRLNQFDGGIAGDINAEADFLDSIYKEFGFGRDRARERIHLSLQFTRISKLRAGDLRK